MEENGTMQTNEKYKEGAYEKTLLYLYPYMRKRAMELETSLKLQAQGSYSAREDTEALVERLLQYDYMVNLLLWVKQEITLILQKFTREELYILERRYFRRKKRLLEYKREPVGISERTFYRRLGSVVMKFSAALKRRGMDEGWFEENFLKIHGMRAIYERICNHKNVSLFGRSNNENSGAVSTQQKLRKEQPVLPSSLYEARRQGSLPSSKSSSDICEADGRGRSK